MKAKIIGVKPMDKKTFVISETQNAGSSREGTKIQAISLSAAKLIATKNQMFQNTYLKIESESGDVLSVKYNKDRSGKWHDSND